MGAVPVAMTIAGSDPTGGAGIQADLKTFHQHRVYGTAVIALVTVQDTRAVRKVVTIDPEVVAAQIDAVLEDLPPAAAKTGALGSARVIEAVAERVAGSVFPLVVDPILAASHGEPLLDEEGRAALRSRLVPRAALVTPNLEEAAWLSGREVRDLADMESAAKAIAEMGAASVLVTGGGGAGEAVDLLYSEGRLLTFREERIEGVDCHGTGCTLSAAITANLAKGMDLARAVATAKMYVTRAIRSRPGLGRGSSPLDHLAATGPASGEE